MSNQNQAETTIINMRGIPKDIYKQFKALCAMNEITATQGVIELMREAVQPEPPEHDAPPTE